MSNLDLAIASNDLAVSPVPSQTPSDRRILTAEELSLGQQMMIRKESRFATGWLSPPTFNFIGDRTLLVQGSLRSSLFRESISINGEVVIPALPDATSTVNRDESLSLVVFVAEVGYTHDPALWVTITEDEIDGEGNLTGLKATQFDGENTRRYRLFWGLIHSQVTVTEAVLWDLLTANDAISDSFRELTVTTGGDGFALGSTQFYAIDPNLVNGKVYPILKSAIEVFPLCLVVRRQKYLSRGYEWGKNGEAPLSVDFNIKPLFSVVSEDMESVLLERCYKIMSGTKGNGFCYSRSVKNLFGGLATAPSPHQGELTRSPNGSYLVSNGQRVGFLNQRILQDYYVQVCFSQYETGDGDVLVTANMNTDVPVSTQFGDASKHRIFDEQGVEQTYLGTFLVPNGYNTLTWVAGPNSSFYCDSPASFVSKKAFFVPGIYFSSGSGFPEFFVSAEAVYRDGIAFSNANIRDGLNDLDAYVDPANNESFIAILAKERSSLLRIYKKVVLTANADGKVFVPDTENGLFAFIVGKINPETGGNRLNSVMASGFAPNQANIKALIYYPLKSSGEQWQIQFKVSPYQGVGTTQNINDVVSFLNGAKIITSNRFFVHTLGGGGSVFHGDGSFQFLPISFVLPSVAGGLPCYELDGPIHFSGQGSPGPINFREIPALSATDYALPALGMTLSTISRSPVAHPNSLNIALFTDKGVPLGFGTPTFTRPSDEFQYVLCFAVEKNGDRRIVIATHNGVGGVSYSLDSAQNTAIDLFYF